MHIVNSELLPSASMYANGNEPFDKEPTRLLDVQWRENNKQAYFLRRIRIATELGGSVIFTLYLQIQLQSADYPTEDKTN